MRLRAAINASQVAAARGYTSDGKCVCSVAFYDDQIMMLRGFGGDWDKKWSAISEEDQKKIDTLDFRPFGPKPADQIEQEIKDAITEIVEDDDTFEPMGETRE